MIEPLFLNRASSSRPSRMAVLRHGEAQAVRGLLLYVHPFAEEMNKARRMAALQATALAARGWAVLAIDLMGCGDSEGDFAEASWDDWVTDVVFGAKWLRERFAAAGPLPLWLWGLRTGALVAAQAADQLEDQAEGLLFWQPVTQGRQALTQFLRLKSAADMLQGGKSGGAEALRQAALGGGVLQIAGYTMPSAVARGLDAAELTPPTTPTNLLWFEVSSAPELQPSPAASRVASRWRESGSDVRLEVVAGPAFWQTTEIEVAPALLSATTAALAMADQRRPATCDERV